MLAHYLEQDLSAKYGYTIQILQSSPDRRPWTKRFRAPLSNPQDYSGFLSFVSLSRTAGAVYLAPPETAEVGHRKTLRWLELSDNPAASEKLSFVDSEVDPDVCSCCQTATVLTPTGLFLAYRDHQPGEIRDISYIRQVNGKWTTPQSIHANVGKINGCPTDGPALAAQQNRVAVTSLTRAQDQPRVQLSFSHNAGESFEAPFRIDDGNPLGRPSLLFLDSGDALVAWLEKTNGGAEIRLRRVSSGLYSHPSIKIAATAAAKSAGFPKIAISGQDLLIAWRDDSQTKSLRAVTISLLSVPGKLTKAVKPRIRN